MTKGRTKTSPMKLTKLGVWIWINQWLACNEEILLMVDSILTALAKIFIGGEFTPILNQENKSKTVSLNCLLIYSFKKNLILVPLYKLFPLNAFPLYH